MKLFKSVLFGFLMLVNLYAQEKNLEDVDKLDVLDQQSKEFFKAITGLEKDYLEEQISQIQSSGGAQVKGVNKNVQRDNEQGFQESLKEKVLSPEEIEKSVFQSQNEMARLKTEFARTKMLSDIKIKSMYSFNGKSYVVLEANKPRGAISNKELSSSIEGRYKRGDFVLGHKVVSVNTRTKTLKLYKKLDDKYGYYINLSNYGISVSSLEKVSKIEAKKDNKKSEQRSLKESKEEKEVKIKKQNLDSCIYRVSVNNLNVRNRNSTDGRILRVLKINDKFTIEKAVGDWLKLDTIYKYISGDTMPVKNKNNWVRVIRNHIKANKENCL